MHLATTKNESSGYDFYILFHESCSLATFSPSSSVHIQPFLFTFLPDISHIYCWIDSAYDENVGSFLIDSEWLRTVYPKAIHFPENFVTLFFFRIEFHGHMNG